MRIRFKAWIFIGAAIAVGLVLFRVSSKAQAPAAPAQTYRAPRTADGRPNLNGIWQALNEANWDLEPHAAAQGPYSRWERSFRLQEESEWSKVA